MNYKGGFLKWLEPVRPITGTEPKVPEAEVPEIHKAEAQAGLLRQEAIPPERKAIRIAQITVRITRLNQHQRTIIRTVRSTIRYVRQVELSYPKGIKKKK